MAAPGSLAQAAGLISQGWLGLHGVSVTRGLSQNLGKPTCGAGHRERRQHRLLTTRGQIQGEKMQVTGAALKQAALKRELVKS